MSRAWKRAGSAGLRLAGCVVFLALAAAGCGGERRQQREQRDGDRGARNEPRRDQAEGPRRGQLNIVEWAGTPTRRGRSQFKQETGCKVNTKDGASSDDMVS